MAEKKVTPKAPAKKVAAKKTGKAAATRVTKRREMRALRKD